MFTFTKLFVIFILAALSWLVVLGISSKFISLTMGNQKDRADDLRRIPKARLPKDYATKTIMRTRTIALETVTDPGLIVTATKTVGLVTETVKVSFLENNGEENSLSHVVIPFAFKDEQYQRIERTFNRWVQFKPCVAGSWPNTPGNSTPTIIILGFSKPQNNTLIDRLTNLINSIPPDVKGCFKDILISFAHLPESLNNHMSGSRAMFEAMLTNKIGMTNPKYVFWMEPDTVPIQNDWLNVMDRDCRLSRPFWIKGTCIRNANIDGHRLSRMFSYPYMFHINGNAIYNMDPQEYPKFYQENILPYAKKKSRPQFYFDSIIPEFYMDLDNYGIWQEISHKFVYSDFIQNRWHEHHDPEVMAKKYPGTFLLHGDIYTDGNNGSN